MTTRTWRIGNRHLERRIAVSAAGARTISFVNRLTGREFRVESEEFRLHVQGVGWLTSKDFVLECEGRTVRGGPTREKEFRLVHPASGVRVRMHFGFRVQDFYGRKWIEVDAGSRLVRSIDVERFRVGDGGLERGGFGQPIFWSGEVFLGLEYPAGYNRVVGRAVTLTHYPGRSGPMRSKTAVWGVCPNTPNNRLKDWFLRYIDRNRARPVRYVSQLGEVMWRHPAHSTIEAMSCREIFEDARDTFLKRGVKLDSAYFHGDRLWVNPQSLMDEKPEKDQHPHTLRERVAWARRILGAPVIMHLNTGGGRSSGDHAWFAQNFDMINSRYYCLADPRVIGPLTANLLKHLRRHGFAGYSFDWLWWRKAWECGRKGHRGHIAGARHGREAITDRFIEMTQALRREKPDIFLEDLEVELSPWWLFHADALWSYVGEGDIIPFEVVDGTMKRWLDRHIVYPMSSAWEATPEPEVPFGRNRPSEHMLHYVLWHYLRGEQVESLYFNFPKLSETQKDQVAAIIKWARAREDILLANTTHILGDPLKRETYGLSHFASDNRGVIGVRNPAAWRTDRVRIRLDEAAHFHLAGGPVAVRVVYPHREFLGVCGYGDAFELTVPGDELVVVETEPVRARRRPMASGIRRKGPRTLGRPERRPFHVSSLAFRENGAGEYVGAFSLAAVDDERIELVVDAELTLLCETSVERDTRHAIAQLALPGSTPVQTQGQIEVGTLVNSYHEKVAAFKPAAARALTFVAEVDGRRVKCAEEVFTVPAYRMQEGGGVEETMEPALQLWVSKVGPHPRHNIFVRYPRRFRVPVSGRRDVRFVLRYRAEALARLPVRAVMTAHLIRALKLARGPAVQAGWPRDRLPALPADFRDEYRDVVTLLAPRRIGPRQRYT